jgi:hypothetical protein
MTGKILKAVPLLLIPNGGDIPCERNEEQFTSTLATFSCGESEEYYEL